MTASYKLLFCLSQTMTMSARTTEFIMGHDSQNAKTRANLEKFVIYVKNTY